MTKTYSFVNHVRLKNPKNVISLIEKEMSDKLPPLSGTQLADVIFLHFPAHDFERVLDEYVRDGEISSKSVIVLCSSYPCNIVDVLSHPGLQEFAHKYVLGDPATFLRSIDEFVSGLKRDQIRTDLLAARATPEALIGLYLLLKAGLSEGCVNSYRTQNAEILVSEAKVHFREEVKIDQITETALADVLAIAFSR